MTDGETRLRVLVVDDDLAIREALSRTLEKFGYEVVLAKDGQEGLDRLRQSEVHILLADLQMPKLGGQELLQAAKAIAPDVEVIVITGHGTVEDAVEAMKEGAYDFIAKPFSGDVLLLTVERGLERRRLLSEAHRLEEVERRAEALVRDRDEMERLDRFKSSFMLMVAHELRAPVTGAQSLLRTLVRGMAGELTDRQREILSRVEARHNELLDLINDLLTLAAGKSMAPDTAIASVDVMPLLEEVVERFRPQAEQAGVELIVQSSDQIPRVRATPDALVTVFSNLIGNAVKYTGRGGRVTTSVHRGNDEVEVQVTDTGIGIAAEDLPRIGEEFFRAGNAKKSGVTGTGLGLAIVQQNLERFGGRMEVRSEIGRGSTFRILLPMEA